MRFACQPAAAPEREHPAAVIVQRGDDLCLAQVGTESLERDEAAVRGSTGTRAPQVMRTVEPGQSTMPVGVARRQRPGFAEIASHSIPVVSSTLVGSWSAENRTSMVTGVPPAQSHVALRGPAAAR